MRRRAAIVVVAAVMAASGACSTTLESRPQADGSCYQERSKKFLGVTYSTNQYRVACSSQ